MGCAASTPAPPPPAPPKKHKKHHHKKKKNENLEKVTEPEETAPAEAPAVQDGGKARRRWKIAGAVVIATIPEGTLTEADKNEEPESDDIPEALEVPPAPKDLLEDDDTKELLQQNKAAVDMQRMFRGFKERKAAKAEQDASTDEVKVDGEDFGEPAPKHKKKHHHKHKKGHSK